MNAHSITHEKPPLRWHEGFPLGNGVLGAMVWGDGDPLCFTLDHADLWDLRCDESFLDDPRYTYAGLRRLIAEGKFDEAKEVFEEREKRDNPVLPGKISLGRAELRLTNPEEYRATLDLSTATVTGNGWQAFVHKASNVLCIRTGGGELSMIPLAEMTPELGPIGYADPVVTDVDGIRILAQQVPEGPAFAVAWNPVGIDFFVAVGVGNDVKQASNDASEGVKRALERGFLTLLAEHNALWEAFWAVSEVHLPEPRMEFLWRYGVYILGSCSKPGHAPPGLQGLWAMDGVLPPWRGDYHADMNVQEIFWPAFASGHLDLADTWCDLMKAEIPTAQAFTRRFFGTEGTFRPGTTVPEFTSVPCWYTVEYAWSHSGWLAWLVWLRWRYSMDRAWLAEVGYPVVSEIFKFYRANLEEGEDGRLHVPLSNSPEYREDKPEAWCSDPNIDLALIRRCCVWVTEMEAALGVEELTADAARIREQLAPYALTDDGALCLWKDKPLDDPHRHPSHLMAIHPAMDLTIEGTDEDRRIIFASIRQYQSLGQYLWAGHSYAQLIGMAAVTGLTGWAYQSLRTLADHWLGPNGLHFNQDMDRCGMSGYAYPEGVYGPFTIEANCGAAAGISDMLVQGWGGGIRLFPAVPEEWRDAAFRGLLVEGAFKVSAVRRDGKTVWVKVVATVDGKATVRDPFGGEKAVGVRCEERCAGCEAGCYVAELAAGEAMVLAREGVEVDEADIASTIRPWEGKAFGLKK